MLFSYLGRKRKRLLHSSDVHTRFWLSSVQLRWYRKTETKKREESARKMQAAGISVHLKYGEIFSTMKKSQKREGEKKEVDRKKTFDACKIINLSKKWFINKYLKKWRRYFWKRKFIFGSDKHFWAHVIAVCSFTIIQSWVDQK